MYSPEKNLHKQLSRKDLFDISEEIRRGFSPEKPVSISGDELDLELTRQQMLEVSENISLYYAPRILSNTHTLTLLSVNPEQFYVYWNLADYYEYSDSLRHQDYDLKLRVYSHSNEYSDNKKARLVYETTVSGTQSRQKITVQKNEKGVVYTASLGKSLSENSFIALVNSNEIYSFYEINDQKHSNDFDDQSMTTKDDVFRVNFGAGKEHILIDKNLSKKNTVFAKSHYAGTNASAKGIKK